MIKIIKMITNSIINKNKKILIFIQPIKILYKILYKNKILELKGNKIKINNKYCLKRKLILKMKRMNLRKRKKKNKLNLLQRKKIKKKK
jgi:hypothetical protein